MISKKTMSVPSIVQIEEVELRELLHEVEERVATDYSLSQTFKQKRKFTAVDFWNCRKQSRTAGIMIR